MSEDVVVGQETITEELDQVIPKHQLLDNTAAKHKNELVHRSILATRHRPSGEGLRTQILRRQLTDSREGSPAGISKEQPVPPPPPPSNTNTANGSKSSQKPRQGKSFLADIQAALGTKCKDNATSDDEENIVKEDNGMNKQSDESPREDRSPVNSPLKGKRPSFLAGIEDAVKRRGSDTPGEPLLSLPVLKKATSKVKPHPIVMEKSSVQDQLRMKLEARKKLVDETDEGTETET